jgi:Tfp pilus assembly protein PilF
MATAYQGMEEYAQAKTLLTEAVRLHPRHPVVLATMAEVLYELEEYDEAKEYINRSLSIRFSSANEKLKQKIELKKEIKEADTSQQQHEDDPNEF